MTFVFRFFVLLKYGLSDELIAGIFYIQVFFFGSVHGSAEFFL